MSLINSATRYLDRIRTELPDTVIRSWISHHRLQWSPWTADLSRFWHCEFELMAFLVMMINHKSDNWNRCMETPGIRYSNNLIKLGDIHQDQLWSPHVKYFMKIWPLFRLLLEVKGDWFDLIHYWILIECTLPCPLQKTVFELVNIRLRTTNSGACAQKTRELSVLPDI